MKYLKRFDSKDNSEKLYRLSEIKELVSQYLSYLNDNPKIYLNTSRSFITDEIEIIIYKEFGNMSLLDLKKMPEKDKELSFKEVMIELLPFLKILVDKNILDINDKMTICTNDESRELYKIDSVLKNELDFETFTCIIIHI